MKKQTLDLRPFEAILEIVREADNKVRKRCLYEGCRFGYEPTDKDPKDNCIYCGEPRNYIFDLPAIRKSIKKLKIKGL